MAKRKSILPEEWKWESEIMWTRKREMLMEISLSTQLKRANFHFYTLFTNENNFIGKNFVAKQKRWNYQDDRSSLECDMHKSVWEMCVLFADCIKNLRIVCWKLRISNVFLWIEIQLPCQVLGWCSKAIINSSSVGIDGAIADAYKWFSVPTLPHINFRSKWWRRQRHQSILDVVRKPSFYRENNKRSVNRCVTSRAFSFSRATI